MVSWASFTRYQELRQEASNFHKELLALKAKAVESGNTFTIKYESDKMGYKVTETGKDDDDFDINKTVDSVRFVKNVTIVPQSSLSDIWATGITIKVDPDNKLDVFGKGEGNVVIKNSSKKEFRIHKDENSIKPELQYRTDGGNTWKKI
jgi:hypothetical protein